MASANSTLPCSSTAASRILSSSSSADVCVEIDGGSGLLDDLVVGLRLVGRGDGEAGLVAGLGGDPEARGLRHALLGGDVADDRAGILGEGEHGSPFRVACSSLHTLPTRRPRSTPVAASPRVCGRLCRHDRTDAFSGRRHLAGHRAGPRVAEPLPRDQPARRGAVVSSETTPSSAPMELLLVALAALRGGQRRRDDHPPGRAGGVHRDRGGAQDPGRGRRPPGRPHG